MWHIYHCIVCSSNLDLVSFLFCASLNFWVDLYNIIGPHHHLNDAFPGEPMQITMQSLPVTISPGAVRHEPNVTLQACLSGLIFNYNCDTVVIP